MIASIITGICNGDLADVWRKETRPTGTEKESCYRNAVRNALKKSKRIEHVTARNGRLFVDCLASRAIGNLSRASLQWRHACLTTLMNTQIAYLRKGKSFTEKSLTHIYNRERFNNNPYYDIMELYQKYVV